MKRRWRLGGERLFYQARPSFPLHCFTGLDQVFRLGWRAPKVNLGDFLTLTEPHESREPYSIYLPQLVGE